ncbi:MAG: right-handed parallel beta-helix repeat-containing protein [Candidatus Thorarchaeota archaeon]|jgi:hypothetical protein
MIDGPRGFLSLILLVLFVLSLLPGTPSGSQPIIEAESPSQLSFLGEVVVENVSKWENQTILLNGNLTINATGELTMYNVTLIVNSTFDGQYGIFVEEGGKLFVHESNITVWDRNTTVVIGNISDPLVVSKGLKMKFDAYGNLTIERSKIGYLWGEPLVHPSWKWDGGIRIFSDDVTIRDTHIGRAEILGLSAWQVRNLRLSNVTFTLCNISAAQFVSSQAHLDNITAYQNGEGYSATLYFDESDFTVTNSHIFSNSQHGIWSANSLGSVLESNISDNMQDGLISYEGTLHIEGNLMNNNWEQNGIFLQRDHGSRIIDNYFANNGGSHSWGSGVFLTAPNGTFLHGNTMVNNFRAGLYILGGPWDPIIVENATVFGNPTGIFTEQNVAGSYVINSSIDSTEYDIRINYNDHPSSKASNMTVLNTTFDKNKVLFMDTKSHLSVKWLMHVHVINNSGVSVPLAQVEVEDVQDHLVHGGTTDRQGYLRWLVVQECNRSDANGDHDGLDPGEMTMFTPHNVTASKDSVTGYAIPDPVMNESKTVTVILNIDLPPRPPEVRLTTKFVNDDDILLNWTASDSQFLDHYLIYRSSDQREFDFSSPIYDTSGDMFPLRTNWTDNDVANQSASREYYYIVRAVTQQGVVSNTSNTAGKWTSTFGSGVNSFSLPLEPFENHNISWYADNIPNLGYIRWANSTGHWVTHYPPMEIGINDTQARLGEGYEISLSSTATYTFVGSPASMIGFHEGFGDSITFRRSLSAGIEGNDINLSWEALSGASRYVIFRSEERGSLHNLSLDPIANTTDTHWRDLGVLENDEEEHYYMVIPLDSGGDLGSSTYSIGVFSVVYSWGSDTFALPLKSIENHTLDWYCDEIPDVAGMAYVTFEVWKFHAKEMPEGVYDVSVAQSEGFQISTDGTPTRFTFIGH